MNTEISNSLSIEEQAAMFRTLMQKAQEGAVTLHGMPVTPELLASFAMNEALENRHFFGEMRMFTPALGSLLCDVHIGMPPRQLDRHLESFMSAFADTFNSKEFAMKLPGQCRGWEAKMRKEGFTVKTASRFGHLEHTISRGGHSSVVIQGTTALIRSKVHFGFSLAPVIAALKSVGAVVLFNAEVKETEHAS